MSTCADCGFAVDITCQPDTCGFAGATQFVKDRLGISVSELLKQHGEMIQNHGDVLTNLEDEVALTVKLEAELEYYKKLAHLWEVACQDMRLFKPDNMSSPISYSAAVTYSHERIVSIVDVAEKLYNEHNTKPEPEVYSLNAADAAAAVFERPGAQEALERMVHIGAEYIKDKLKEREMGTRTQPIEGEPFCYNCHMGNVSPCSLEHQRWLQKNEGLIKGVTVIPDTRKAEILVEGQWYETAFEDLKAGDLVRMFEPDGKEVDSGEISLVLSDTELIKATDGESMIRAFNCVPAGRRDTPDAG